MREDLGQQPAPAVAEQRDLPLRRLVDDRAGSGHAGSQQDGRADDGGREARLGDDALRAAFRAQISIGRFRIRAEHADQHGARDSGVLAGIHDGLGRIDVGRLIAGRGALEENAGEMHDAIGASQRSCQFCGVVVVDRARRGAGRSGKVAGGLCRSHARDDMDVGTCSQVAQQDLANTTVGSSDRNVHVPTDLQPSAAETCPNPWAVSRRAEAWGCRELRRTPAAS